MSEVPNKLSKENVVSSLAFEMRSSISRLAGERAWSETRKRWLDRAARKANISYRQARSLFYMEQPDPRASVVEQIRAAVARTQQDRLQEAKNEYRQVLECLTRLETALRVSDADFHQPQADALREMARGPDRPLGG